MDFALVLIGFFIFVVFMSLVFIRTSEDSRVKEAYIESMFQRAGIHFKKPESVAQQTATKFWNPIADLINTRLKRAGLAGAKSARRIAIIQVVLTLVALYVLPTQYNFLDPKVLIFVAILPFLPSAFVLLKQQQRQNKIKNQFPEMLDTLVRALQSGHGIDGALDMIAKEFSAPLGTEIKEVSSQLQIGISLREILREFQRRVNLVEAQYFVIAVIIQRETGGQLSLILDDLSKMMRRRERFVGKLKTLTAESRFTALFIGGAPVVYLAYKFLFAIESMQFFLEDPVGQIMLWGSIGLITLGIIILRMMMSIRF